MYADMKNLFDRFQKKDVYFKIGAVLLLFFAVVVVISLFYTPYEPTAMNKAEKFVAPCPAHPFGTDNFGRDILSRVMTGLQDTFLIALGVVAIGAVVGSVIGALTGYFGGWVDDVLMRVNDILTAFPSVLLALVFVSLWGSGKYKIIAALGIAFIPSFVRLVRGEMLKLREADFVDSARLMGVSHLRIIFVHIFPNLMPTLLSAIAVGFNNAILAESGMSYLGIGVTPPNASLGNMLSDAQGYLLNAPWYALAPGITIILLILAFSFVSEKQEQEG
jgi:peptide/nickel transport system permease protein